MLRLFSPAKLNLSLSLIGKRLDGYHELSSLFQTISLGDWINFQPHSCDLLTCSDPQVPLDYTNLILKAIALYREKTGLNFGLKIHVEKRIPLQAGLGGGSSNAATTLWACNELFGKKASEFDLRQWGAEIGSDISFFFSSGLAHCTGRGEHVNSLAPTPAIKLWVVNPLIGLSTGEVFSHVELSHCSGQIAPDAYTNDLEKAAFKLRPELKELKKLLLQCGFEKVVMTGTGSSLFCYGNAQLPPLPACNAYSVVTIYRKKERWYYEETA
ncbi:MAG: 4-(cytidine 5'-diphospho)-2-C-methyl-D-erythritol kinase [Parachlamydia sp.]|jgi:4-diphosphocytidyl-2-C-methyl-D-erythritol kinase|nr:4-(cytidine 5'-diphospho)-2-C-methyl-D-erythritol kinase [Parachlamydia sp.]